MVYVLVSGVYQGRDADDAGIVIVYAGVVVVGLLGCAPGTGADDSGIKGDSALSDEAALACWSVFFRSRSFRLRMASSDMARPASFELASLASACEIWMLAASESSLLYSRRADIDGSG